MVYVAVYIGLVLSSYNWYMNRLPEDPVKAEQYLECEAIHYKSLRDKCFKGYGLKP